MDASGVYRRQTPFPVLPRGMLVHGDVGEETQDAGNYSAAPMRAVSNPRCAQQDCSAETNSHHRQIQSLLDALVSEVGHLCAVASVNRSLQLQGLDAEKMSEIRDVLENREHSEIYALKE
ncbi:hypothetical protein FOZ62_004785 [Perkinsus olseni]|uniref:Uncharacterized protein n=1 Tax=Perkinsus olseni TaxID=32597 RepID=A0A7J6THV5_PEROL|nr:hypothetical protein FOZ62_004785 [Perkinsus olseni]